MALDLTSLDLWVMAAYVALVIGIAVWVSRRIQTGDDLFLAGRSLAWGVIGLSLFASNVSSTTFIGLAGQAYNTGISVANYEWMATLVLVFMAFFVIPFYLNARVTTVPEFLERRFDRRTRLYFSAVTLFLTVVVDTAGALYAGALVLSLFFPDLALTPIVVAMAVFAGLYTAAGGLRAVVYTDVLQALVLLGGAMLVAWLVFAEFDYSFAAATAGAPDGHLSMIRPLDDPALPWLGTLVGVPVLGFYFWATNQYVVQRILGARSLADARRGALLAGLLKLLPVFVMVLPGAVAVTLYPGLDDPDHVFPVLVAEVLPAGLAGLVMAALIAAIMSTVDSTLNSASTLVVHDFVRPERRGLSGGQVRRIGRLTTLGFMVLAVLWAPQIQHFEGLFAYLQEALSYVVPPVVTIFLLGIFWPRGSRAAALATLIAGHLFAAVLFVARQTGWLDWHFTLLAGLIAAVSAVVFIGASLLGPAPEPRSLSGLTWLHRERAAPERLRWYQDYRWQAAVLVALTAVLVAVFR